MRQLRVCFVAGTLGQGGAERQLFYMLRVLKDAGADPVVLALTSGEFWENHIRALGIPIEWVGRHASKLARLWAITAAVLRWKPQLIQSQHAYTNPYATAAGRGLRVPVIAAVRNDFVSEIKGDGAAARRWGYRHAGVVAANSKAALRAALSSGIPRGALRLLPNVVDVAEFSCPERAPRAPVHILSVGRLAPQKRHDRFLRTLAELRKVSATPFRATVMGAGPEQAALEGLAASLGLLPEMVRIAEPSAQMMQVYRDADVFALTSDHEGTPNVVLEAMAAGLPVVSTTVGDATDIIRDGETGFLVSNDDESALVNRLSQLVNSPQLRYDMGLRARRHIDENFSLGRLPGYLNELYEIALA